MNKAERDAEKKNREILRFTNIDKESFTHSYKGVSITVQAGESYVGRAPELNHLAKHLARKMLARTAKAKSSKDDGKIKLWTPEQVQGLKKKILTSMGNESSPAAPTPEEKRKEDLEKIGKDFPPKPAPPVTKKQVIADIKARGVEVDVKKTLEELLSQLMKLEEQGVLPK